MDPENNVYLHSFSSGSKYLEHANTTIKWIDVDNPMTFEGNKDFRKKYNLDWTEDSITYKFNKFGFRSDEFDTSKDGALFIGCSHTMGVGSIWEETWPYMLSKKLNLLCWNLGQGGASSDSAYRLSHYWINVLKPKIIFFLVPYECRREIFRFENLDLREAEIAPHTEGLHKELKKIILSDFDNYLNRQKNIEAILYKAQQNNTRVLILPAEIIDEVFNDDLMSKRTARDGVHFGKEVHQWLADTFIKEGNL